MSSREQTWREELQDLFDYNPPAIKKSDNPTHYRLPFTFFDRHIDSRLSLQRIVSVPSFTADVAHVIDRAVQATKDEGGRFPVIDFADEHDLCALISKNGRNWGGAGSKLTDAVSVGRFYTEVSFLYCASVGSTLALNPHSHTWLTVFQFYQAGTEPDNGRSSMTSQFHLEILRDADNQNMHIPKGVWDSLDDDGRMDITEVFARFRQLVTYQFYAATAEYDGLLENMGNVAEKEPVPPFQAVVSGFPRQEMLLAPVADSSILPWRPHESKETFDAEGKKSSDPPEQATNEPSSSNKQPTQSQGVTVSKSAVVVDDTTTFLKHVSPTVHIFPYQGNIRRRGPGPSWMIQLLLYFTVESTSVLESATVQVARYSFLTLSMSIVVETQGTASFKPGYIY